jgi:hypothetical protein
MNGVPLTAQSLLKMFDLPHVLPPTTPRFRLPPCDSESRRTKATRKSRPSAPVKMFDRKRESRFMGWSESIN